MLLLLAIAAIVIIAVSLYTDYKWRRWMAARQREHHDQRTNSPEA